MCLEYILKSKLGTKRDMFIKNIILSVADKDFFNKFDKQTNQTKC